MIMVSDNPTEVTIMPTSTASPALVDAEGHPLFTCAACRSPLTSHDLSDFGLRAPDFGESEERYGDAELIDPRELQHLACLIRQDERA